MELAILADTHGLLRPEVLAHLKRADAILHAGDVNTPALADQLRQIAPLHLVRGGGDRDWAERIPHDLTLYLVRGNNDKAWAQSLPHDLTVTLAGVTFYLIHNRKEIVEDLGGVDAVVFGHSHRYVQEEKGGRLWLNPGSCGPRRFHQEITMMMAHVSEGSLQVEKILLPRGEK